MRPRGLPSPRAGSLVTRVRMLVTRVLGMGV
jgi:hypothetical protein